jgi:hypothetical protein
MFKGKCYPLPKIKKAFKTTSAQLTAIDDFIKT